ncbi:nuclear cap-binding protein subunit 3-like [Sitophilus oryzae]|uniref:Nuclear cap-binding protein subunit 3 n=1 Tax=Sitophilus oryzae TaxID=7048 RepID=A0A6J2YF09_SITOR|nr:nuclear cap-binding protein subunit 3-like [Sitophilus oryzae]
MDVEPESDRPNIRIQIQNNISNESVEKMDVDEDLEENEEGEILDDNGHDISEILPPTSENKISTGIFTTGINVFDKNEELKLQERAKRFALKPDEIHSFTDENLQELYDSLGIKPSNEKEIKFEKIHLLGLDDMGAEDILDYFAGYAPDGIEWIDGNSCNLVWLDSFSAARAMHFKSKPVRGMPARQAKEVFPKEFLDDTIEEREEDDQSILIKNLNREIELRNEIGEVILPKKKVFPKNSVDISEISIPIPPGYWRLGVPHPKTKCLLVRFGLITDKIPFKSEKCSKYYKKTGISENKKKELRSIFERNKELNQSKNPWGSLAKNWDNDAKFREREPTIYNLSDTEEPQIEVKNPKLLARLGTKRQVNSEEIVEEPQKPEKELEVVESKKWPKERKNNKVPRMKMYADEEEENMKRKKILQRIKKQSEVIEKKSSDRDLRDMLGPTNRLVMKKDLPIIDRVEDLGSKLRNRNQKMIYAIERDLFDRPPPHIEFLTRNYFPDVREQLNSRTRAQLPERDRSPLVSASHRLYHDTRDRHEDKRNRERPSHRSSRRRTPERTLHSDQIKSETSRIRRSRRSYSREDRVSHKPKSKVAVVIKTQKKPTVASTIWSRVKQSSDSNESSSESESEEGSDNSSSSSESESESESGDSSSDASRKRSRNPDRPGFDKSRLSQKLDHKSPLKITMPNDRYRNRK